MVDMFPKSWEICSLEEITEPPITGRRPKGGVAGISEGVLSIGGEHLTTSGTLDITNARYIPEKFAADIPHAQIRPHQILVVKDGATTGKACLVGEEFSHIPAYLNEHVFALNVIEGINPVYLFYFLLSEYGKKEILKDFRGVAQGGITKGFVSKVLVPVPPRVEQDRIVEKIAELRQKISVTIEAIEKNQKLLEAYWNNLLVVGFRGNVSNKNNDKNSPYLSDGKHQKLSHIVYDGPSNGKSPKSGKDAKGSQSLKLSATTKGYMDLSDKNIKRLYEVFPEDSKYWLEPGDILIQRANSIEYVGTTAIFEGPRLTYIYPDLMMRIRVEDVTLRKLLWFYLNSPMAKSYFRANATGTAGNMPKINGSTVRNTPVPMPPKAEAKALLDMLEKAFDQKRELERNFDATKKRLAVLADTVLKTAFEGSLTSQETAHKANVLLDQVRKNRIIRMQQLKEEKKATRRTRAKREVSTMKNTKTRADVHRTYLSDLVKSDLSYTNTKALYIHSGMEIAEFYKQLRYEMAQNLIKESDSKDRLELVNAS